MTKSDPNELREKAHWKQLTEEELAEVIQRINDHLNNTISCNEFDLVALLEALGYTGAFTGIRPGFIELVEKFLDYPDDPLVTPTALSILCTDWDLASHYTKQIKSFIKGVEWDEGYAMTSAIHHAGEYIRQSHDREMLECLLEVFFNKDQRLVDRNNVYQSISRAVGLDWDDLHDIDPDHYSENPIAKGIIVKAQEMMKK